MYSIEVWMLKFSGGPRDLGTPGLYAIVSAEPVYVIAPS